MARFLCDAMCGSLARLLRMCGHDAAYTLDRGVEADDAVLALARDEDRVLLTRDRALASRVPDAVLLTSRDVDEQLSAVAAAGYDLTLDEPTRCGACNGPLERVPAGAETPADVPDPDAESVWRCRDCGQCFWRGSHWADLRERLPD